MLYLTRSTATNFVEHLNGMYGFALWDARRQRLLIGRDRLGVKPIYLHNDGKRLAFAARPRHCSHCPASRRSSIRPRCRSYLQLGYVPAPQSIFRGIRKLPPATLLVVEDGRVQERRYWRVPVDVDHTVSEDEWIEPLRARLEQSVRMQMVSDVPIGAFLSGGVDSSAVVAFMCGAPPIAGQDVLHRLRRQRRREPTTMSCRTRAGARAVRHRAPRDRRKAGCRLAVAAAAVAHG